MSKKVQEVVLCVEYDDFIKMIESNNVEYYPNGTGIQCHFCLPNGHTWLIIWCESIPPMNVTIHDGEVNAIIYDKI